MTDCLFCGIVAGDIPAARVRESPRTVAFPDINPQAPVHVLVIPREHYPDLAALAAAAGCWPSAGRRRCQARDRQAATGCVQHGPSGQAVPTCTRTSWAAAWLAAGLTWRG